MVLDQVALAHPESRDRLRVTLEKWLQLNIGVTWRTLELAITNANRQCLGYDPLTRSKGVIIACSKGNGIFNVGITVWL